MGSLPLKATQPTSWSTISRQWACSNQYFEMLRRMECEHIHTDRPVGSFVKPIQHNEDALAILRGSLEEICKQAAILPGIRRIGNLLAKEIACPGRQRSKSYTLQMGFKAKTNWEKDNMRRIGAAFQ